ncbi:hypothetical protein QT397_08825 [Microbulbifer sp. MKSA007]|nr:hypothetical protein QT397_08825 [Microbulbifer sp. MKSA007]
MKVNVIELFITSLDNSSTIWFFNSKPVTSRGMYMSIFWVVDTKVRVLPQSSLPQDGSTFYFGRSIVPDESKESAVARLTAALEEDFMLVEEVSNVTTYDSQQWETEADEDFETKESYKEALQTGEIAFGCFSSELSMED